MSGYASGAVTTSMERVLFPLKPHEDESYFGFTARLASWNGFEHRRDLLRALGLQILHTSDIYQAANDTGQLARQLGISSEELGRLTAPQLDPEYRKEFHLRRRRVSARGLNKSLHHRFSWTISRLPYCPQNWDFLAGKCPDCGHELGWSFVVDLHLCERCGYDMRRLKVVSVPTDYRRNLQFLADLVTTNATGEVSPDLKLPAVLTGEARLRVFRLTCLIGRTLALQNTKFRYSKASTLVRVKYLAKGVEVLLGYPESFDALSVGGNGPLPKQLMQLRDFTGSVSPSAAGYSTGCSPTGSLAVMV